MRHETQHETTSALMVLRSAFDVPANVANELKQGFAVIASLTEDEQQRILAWVRTPRAGWRLGDVSSLVAETGLAEQQAAPLRLAVGMMVGTLTESGAAVDEFTSAGVESGVLVEANVSGVTSFGKLVVDSRAELQEQRDATQLQDAVLPTLMKFELALDARVQVSDGTVIRGVPVVVAYVDTDAEDQVIWFQMDEPTVREVRDKLTSMLDGIAVLGKSLGLLKN